MEGKVCKKCRKEKDLEEFGNNKNTVDGKAPWCKECKKKSDEVYRQNNKEKIKRIKDIYSKTEKGREAHRKANMRYKKTDKCKATERRYRETEKGKNAVYKGRIKRRSYKNHVNFSPFERKEILKRDNWTCKHCGIKVHDNKRNTSDKAHIDHVIPISKGGNSEPSNLQVLCRTCNLTKSDKVVL